MKSKIYLPKGKPVEKRWIGSPHEYGYDRDILVLTTSIPTPRPLSSVETSLVENPGMKIMSAAASSESLPASSSVMIPFLTAALFSFSISIPLPSSDISMII